MPSHQGVVRVKPQFSLFAASKENFDFSQTGFSGTVRILSFLNAPSISEH
jgi:hypothetical protein